MEKKRLTLKMILKFARTTPSIFVGGSLMALFGQSYAMTSGATELLNRIESKTPTEISAQSIVTEEVQNYLREKAEAASNSTIMEDIKRSGELVAKSWSQWGWSEADD
jgi:hypothetical protein